MESFINLHDTNLKTPPMIEMFIDNKQLVLPSDIKVRVELNSPAFGKDTIPASVVYHFDLPIHQNEEIFNYAQRIEIAGKYREYNWTMSYYGIPLLRGKLIVTNASTRFRCAATLKQLPSDFGDKNITDFAFEEIPINGTMTEFVTEARGPKEKRMAFPRIFANHLYGDKNENNPAFGQIINDHPSVENTDTNKHTVIPLFHSLYVMEEIFGKENYKLDTSTINPAIKNLLLFNNHTLDTVSPNYYARASVDGAIISGHKGAVIPIESSDDPHALITLNTYCIEKAGDYDITLDILSTFSQEMLFTRVRYFVLCSKWNVSKPEDMMYIEIDSRTGNFAANRTFSTVFTKTVNVSSEFATISLHCLVEVLEGDDPNYASQTVSTGFVEFCRASNKADQNEYIARITPKNHLPEVSVSDLLMSHKQMFGIGFYFDDSTAQIQLLENKELFKTKALDLSSSFIEKATDIEICEPQSFCFKYETDKPTLEGFDILAPINSLFGNDTPKARAEKKIVRVLCANAYYESRYVDRRTNWFWYAPCFPEFSTAENNKEKIDIKASPMPMHQLDKDTSLPYYDGDGVSPMFMPTVEKTDKLIYLVKIDGTTASTSKLAPSGQPAFDNLSLEFDGDYGLYETQLKSWYEFLGNSNVYTCEFRTKVEDMLRIIELFSLQDKPAEEQIRRVRLDNQEYIPEQFTFELTHTQINCKAKLRKDDRA